MKIVVGLGNPEARYNLTRHNIGFLAIDHLTERLHANPVKSNKNSVLFETIAPTTEKSADKILLVKPQTYMNLSGKAVLELMSFYKLKLDDILVITDEIDLTFGTTKLLQDRGHGGHNGLRSIINSVGKNFPRLRIGINQNQQNEQENNETLHTNIPLDKFVLGQFSKLEQKELPKYLDFIGDIAVSFLTKGLRDTMTQYNKRHFKGQF